MPVSFKLRIITCVDRIVFCPLEPHPCSFLDHFFSFDHLADTRVSKKGSKYMGRDWFACLKENPDLTGDIRGLLSG